MKNPYHREKIVFRFVGFPEKLLPILKDALPGVELQMGRQKKTNVLVVCFELRRRINQKKLCTFLRENKIGPDKFGLWVSLTTERDSDGVHVPNFAVKLLQETGGQLDFSFTSI